MGIERRADHWLWVGGPVPPGADAITIGSVISVRRRHARSAGLLRHEEEHVRQWRELGAWRFLRVYLGSYLASRWRGFGHAAAYRLIPLEIEAEDAARRFLADAGLRGPDAVDSLRGPDAVDSLRGPKAVDSLGGPGDRHTPVVD